MSNDDNNGRQLGHSAICGVPVDENGTMKLERFDPNPVPTSEEVARKAFYVDRPYGGDAEAASMLRALDRERAKLKAEVARLNEQRAYSAQVSQMEAAALKTANEKATKMETELARLSAELATANQWVNDLHSGMYVNCVYCGHRYGPLYKIPATMADALKAHIEQCPKHPMSALKAELAAARRDSGSILDLMEQQCFCHSASDRDADFYICERCSRLQKIREAIDNAEAQKP